jgi:hypothetical protein
MENKTDIMQHVLKMQYISFLPKYTGCLKTCHKLFLGIPHPHLSKKVPINMGP